MKHVLHQHMHWAAIRSLRFQAMTVADGVYAGMHASFRTGTGIEFGGYRPYVAGDDLRRLDRRALMRHNRLMLRLFETETDRQLHLIVDATLSMSFCGQAIFVKSGKTMGEKAVRNETMSKLRYSCLLAAVLSRIALACGDPVSLRYIGGNNARPVALSSGGETFERIVSSLEAVDAQGDALQDEAIVTQGMQALSAQARRGAVIVLLSDLLDLPAKAKHLFASLGMRRRILLAGQVLDREELTLPYKGAVRLKSLEGEITAQVDADSSRYDYLKSLERWTQSWTNPLIKRGGRWVRMVTDQDPVWSVISVVRAIRSVIL